jgi:hypothetical protein
MTHTLIVVIVSAVVLAILAGWVGLRLTRSSGNPHTPKEGPPHA